MGRAQEMRVVPSTRMIAVLAVMVALVAAGPPVQAHPPESEPVGVDAQLQTIELVPTAATVQRDAATARTEAATGAAGVTSRGTRPFSMIGATWTDPHAALDGVIEIRTRSAADGRWSAWRALDSDEANPAEPGSADGPARGSTDPLWVGPSDGVEARLGGGRAGRVPAGLRLDLINPDETTAEATTEAARAADSVVFPRRPVPRLVTRAGWGANEAIVKHPPEYTGPVQVLFVHHTATGNDYACTQSASIIRGIELYHVRSKGWNDVGYNFLVDKCGTLFEGRAGGVDKPVLGAHTLGFNSGSAAIAVIGDYTSRGAPARVRSVIAQVAAYKLGAYGNNPAGRVVV